MAGEKEKRVRQEVPLRQTPFQHKHVQEFGLNAMQTNPNRRVVVSVRCLFCVRVGRAKGAEDSIRKRMRTTNIKYFSPPFRKENFRKHAVE